MPLDYSWEEIFSAFHDTVRDDLRKVLPCVVTGVHADRCTVDVQPMIQNPLFDEFSNLEWEQLPSISDVPLGVFRGGGFLVWVPVAVGDSVLVVFSDLATDSWRASSGTGAAVKPNWTGKHTPSGPFAIPMIAPDSKAPSAPTNNANSVFIGNDSGTGQIQITQSDVVLGQGATNFVALSNLVDSAVSTIVTAFNTHVHTSAAPGSPTTTPTVPITPAPPSTAATIVKAI